MCTWCHHGKKILYYTLVRFLSTGLDFWGYQTWKIFLSGGQKRLLCSCLSIDFRCRFAMNFLFIYSFLKFWMHTCVENLQTSPFTIPRKKIYIYTVYIPSKWNFLEKGKHTSCGSRISSSTWDPLKKNFRHFQLPNKKMLHFPMVFQVVWEVSQVFFLCFPGIFPMVSRNPRHLEFSTFLQDELPCHVHSWSRLGVLLRNPVGRIMFKP